MIHPILLYGTQILKDKSYSIDLVTANKLEIQEMLNDMFETMHQAKGIGLSAIQIGVPVRAFVVEAHMNDENFHIRESFINPVILKESTETIHFTEGCLSLPNIAALVKRPEAITVEYYNFELKKVKQTFDGFAARIIQHEFDHLNGILFTDKLSLMWKTMVKGEMDLIKDKKIKSNYLSK